MKYSAKTVLEEARDPARLIRATLEFHANVGPQAHMPLHVMSAARCAVNVHGNPEMAQHFIDAFRTNVLDERLLDFVVDEPYDRISAKATLPEYCARSAETLADTLGGDSMLLIPMAHGATRAGVDVFVRYVKITGNKDCMLYPVRFSRYKAEDIDPQIYGSEVPYLRMLAQGRRVVILDEDSTTGRTLDEARVSLHQILRQCPVIRTNLQDRVYTRLTV